MWRMSPGQPKVNYLDRGRIDIGCEKDVFWFQVAVNDPGFVQGRDRAQYLKYYLGGFGFVKTPVTAREARGRLLHYLLKQFASLAKFSDDVKVL
mmetsp:Transcript_20308/g.45839  ORF Transcript_20308/g.45839 Transcript_20308/m.45839 type:complete len:94 (+) Transcript_20308:28-309(+)